MISKKSFVSKLALLLVLTSFSFGAVAQERQAIADKAVTLIKKKKIRKLRKGFSPELKQELPSIRFALIWKMLESQAGDLKSIGDPVVTEGHENDIFKYPAEFEKAMLQLRIVVNNKNQISGLRFAPLSHEIPAYAENLVYGKEKIKVKTDTFVMPGELIIPDKCDQCPVVIMVHGSGASDRDEHSPPNKPFYDLAMGLAKHGVASIRYDKRNNVYKHYSEPDAQFTLGDETVDDAISAVSLVKQFPYLDTNRIVVLGHSLGGYAAPMIAAGSPEVDGIVVFAGPTRALNDLIVEQYGFLLSRDGKLSWLDKKIVKDQEKRAKKIKEGDYTESTPFKKLMAYWPGTWWKSVEDYDPAKVASSLDIPILVMQGDADYQVTAESDYPGWQAALRESNATFKLYPGLNHLFVKGEGEKGPGQYLIPGNISEEVIIDIVDWIKK